MADPRKTADLVLGISGGHATMPGGEEPASTDVELDPAREMKRAAAGDAMAAFKSGDVEGLEAALTAFVEACGGGYRDEEG